MDNGAVHKFLLIFFLPFFLVVGPISLSPYFKPRANQNFPRLKKSEKVFPCYPVQFSEVRRCLPWGILTISLRGTELIQPRFKNGHVILQANRAGASMAD